MLQVVSEMACTSRMRQDSLHAWPLTQLYTSLLQSYSISTDCGCVCVCVWLSGSQSQQCTLLCICVCVCVCVYVMHRMLCAECVGGVAAGLMAGPLYGTGATWLKKMLPWIRPTEEPTGDNNELEDQAAPANNNKEMDMQAPLYEAKPNQTDGAKKPMSTYVQDEGTTLV